MSTHIARIAATTAALVGLIATGCSASGSQASPSTAPTAPSSSSRGQASADSITATTISTTAPADPADVSTTVQTSAPVPPAPRPPAPVPAPAPAPSPTPEPEPEPQPQPEPGDPAVPEPDPFFIVNPINYGLFTPRITSVTGPASFRCDDPSEQRAAVRIRWTSINTEFVTVLIDGIGFFAGLEAGSSLWVILDCGADHVVTVMANWPDLSPGVGSSITIAFDGS